VKKIVIALVGVLLLVPACKRTTRQPSKAQPQKHQVTHKNTVKRNSSPKQYAIEDDIDTFNLLDDEPLALAPVERTVALEDTDKVPLVDDRENQKYKFKTILYDWDRANIRSDQKALVEQNIKLAQAAVKEGYTLVAEGHTCKFGSPAYNLGPSEKRAQSLADYYISKGIDPKNIKVIGRGSEMLVVPQGDKFAQSPNRRVETYVISPAA
jgi:outer membrane protein OmpA-like peptidoglycan-associated protein